jgi:hypothetical protein
MDTERIDNLVCELIAFEPSLSEHEASLRTFIRAFEEHKPTVVIDQNFVTGLRARLMLKETPVVSPYQQFNWWALRLAPIGAVALLVLALTSTTPPPIQEQDVSEESAFDDARILEVNQGGDTDTYSTPMNYGMGGDAPAASDMGAESADPTMMSMKSVSVEATPGPFTVSPQTPGVSIVIDSVTAQVPGFAIVSQLLPDGSENPLGTSPLIYEGTTERVPVYLSTRTTAGASYVLRFHVDNGDRRFDDRDVPLTDESGIPLTTWIEILPE